MDEINTDIIHNIISFLVANEQCGDDWRAEIAELNKVLDLVLGN